MLAIIKGMLMNDFIKDSEFEGKKSSSRILHLYQADDTSREMVEIKDIPLDMKFEAGKDVTVPCEVRHWKNNKGQSGISTKFFTK